MAQTSFIDKIKDLLMFREGSDIDNYIVPPTVTTGSIIWGILLRSTIIVLGTSFFVIYWGNSEYWWFAVFFFWFFVAYPAYRQHSAFQSRLQQLKSDTLCGKCKHFAPDSQLCTILDEHIGTEFIPCDGESWEASPDIFDNLY
ncbi:MAG: hypothetical protein LBO69_07390 [Ignavibacteria bacterium]|jgi:hypothetical protein|nr:hypothetical protein [Ignavibacteria bacterium]